MKLQAGREASASVELRCKDCPFVVMVAAGDKIPPCPCGGNDYERLRRKPPERSRRVKSSRIVRRKVA